MAGAGFHSHAKSRVPILRFATTIIKSWQTALKHTADCQPTLEGTNDYMVTIQACGNHVVYFSLSDCKDQQYDHFCCDNPRKLHRNLLCYSIENLSAGLK
jgi:hypothetical protein